MTPAGSPRARSRPRRRKTFPKTRAGGPTRLGRILASTRGRSRPRYEFPRDGEYVLRARAFGQQAGPEPVEDGVRRSTASRSRPSRSRPSRRSPQVYEFRVKVCEGRHTVRRRVPERLLRREGADRRTATATSSSTTSRCRGRSSREGRAAARVAPADHLQDADDSDNQARGRPRDRRAVRHAGPTAGRSRRARSPGS